MLTKIRPFQSFFNNSPSCCVFTTNSLKQDTVTSSVIHIALLSQVGAAGRILVGEWFGGNCSKRVPNESLSWIPCVTSDGVSMDHGGALFQDLPANMLGCFLIGCLTSTSTLHQLYSDFKSDSDRSLVSHEAVLTGLKTGLCGSLTTFASWKLQMVQMLLAGKGTNLSSQWLHVIMGLILGTLVSISCLLVGQHVALAIFTWRNKRKEIMESKPASPDDTERAEKKPVLLTLSALGILVLTSALCLLGVVELIGTGFWRKFCCSVLMAPLGALLRWKLAVLNSSLSTSWIPMGTFLANMLACCVSFLSQGIDTRWTDLQSTAQLILFAIRSGFAGSLSTVSTWVVELQSMIMNYEKISKGYFYALLSQLSALGLGVIIYGSFLWI